MNIAKHLIANWDKAHPKKAKFSEYKMWLNFGIDFLNADMSLTVCVCAMHCITFEILGDE